MLNIKRVGLSLLISLLMTGAAATGIFSTFDSLLCDSLYQSPQALEGNIVLINIDEKALNEIGPFQTWGRDVMAAAIEQLNRDQTYRPAVIGIDVLYSGQSEEKADQALVEAAARYDNVVMASAGTFGTGLKQENDTFYMDDYQVVAYDEPFPALKAVTEQGHINEMYDHDGILRHGIFYIDLLDGSRIPAFNQVIYEKYAKKVGLQATFVPPLDEKGRWYIPYSALPGGYDDGYSIADLLKGEIPADVFADKIVLIGPYASGLRDYVTTPIDRSQLMYGVEFQANAIDSLIAGEFKQEVANFPQLVILFLILFFCFLWFLRCSVIPATITWLAVSLGSVATSYIAYYNGYVVHILHLPLAVTILYIATVVRNYLLAALERRRITGMFKRYVAPEIVNEILKEDSDALGLGGKLTEIAVLFVDIRGFTTMSERLEPAQVVEILNRYLTLTSSCIIENNGTLDKFIGDATMAIWGAPLPQEDCIFKAVKAALDMSEGALAFSEELQKRYGRTVQFGIGIHYGSAVVGNIGAPMHMDYTAIGDTVNIASRLESNAEGGTILVSEIVANAIKDRVQCSPVGERMLLKGKTEEIKVFRVEGLVDERC